MGSVTLIRRPREDLRSKTGLGRYSDGVEDFLQEYSQEYDVIEAPLSLKDGYFSVVVNGFIKPWFKVIRDFRNKDKVVHATDELCGFFFPFVRGHRILTVHHVIRPGEDRSMLYYRLWNGITRCAIRHCEEIIVVSPDTGRAVRRTFNPKVPINVVHSQVGTGCVRDSDARREKVIGVVAELIPRKNVVASLEAFDVLSRMEGMEDYVLEICGRGMCREELDRRIAELGIGDRVRFHESLSDEEMVAFYNRMAVLMNTSMHEGMGMVTIEANICGVPAFHLKDADIPAIVLEASTACDGPADMAAKIHALLNDEEAYAAKSEESIEKGSRYGHDFYERMSDVYGIREEDSHLKETCLYTSKV